MFTAALARHLAEQGHGKFNGIGTGTHIELEPPGKPDAAISVAFKPGPPDNRADGYARPAVQILVRLPNTSGKARSGYDAAQAIRDDLDGLAHITLAVGTPDEIRLVWLMADDGGPTNLGDDSNGTPRWSLRFSALVAHDTAHSRL